MPIYEYVCDACGNDFERMQSFSEAPLFECPRCGAASVRRIISPVGVIFKGSGWYITDSKRQISGSSSASRKGGTSGDGKPGDASKVTGDAKGGDGSSAGTSADDGGSSSSTTATGASKEPTEKKKK